MISLRRFGVRGVFWRQFLRWAVLIVPPWIEPVVIAFWSAFFLLWGPGRRGVVRNLRLILPRSSGVANFFRCYRVFFNYAWTIADNVRFKEEHAVPDWEFEGWQHFDAMQAHGGAVLLTAHMGSYDLGAHLFTELAPQLRIVMVRAPEVDPQTRRFEEQHAPEGVDIEFNTDGTDLAIDLLHALRDGAVVAIQGDRVTPGITAMPVTLFGKTTELPSGPFALALAARAPLQPVFVIRTGRRRYRLLACEPIVVERTRDRDAGLAQAIDRWRALLEEVIRGHWQQWFNFEPL